ncbi:hypothetical protein MHI37_16415 [Paenibacillus sp. FSL H8-0548]|uniref:hypothetical protein n=1 Tax=Paenibacillus sp. FSL H8-0548 TaxID=1920422 RepID=UPI0021165335
MCTLTAMPPIWTTHNHPERMFLRRHHPPPVCPYSVPSFPQSNPCINFVIQSWVYLIFLRPIS